jgi:hypothetical protein
VLGSIWMVPLSWVWAALSAAARNGEVPEYPSPPAARSTPGGAPTLSFERSEMARNRTTTASAVSAIANP